MSLQQRWKSSKREQGICLDCGQAPGRLKFVATLGRLKTQLFCEACATRRKVREALRPRKVDG